MLSFPFHHDAFSLGKLKKKKNIFELYPIAKIWYKATYTDSVHGKVSNNVMSHKLNHEHFLPGEEIYFEV